MRHIRSGEARQWPHAFDRRLARLFLARYGDILIHTGYEADDSWVKQLPESLPTLDGIIASSAAA